jgi:glycosyltransferase involved in cell wall biosynthesis
MELRNINILIILHYGSLGGAQRQALGLAKYLVEERNCNVDLFLMLSDFQTKEFKEFTLEAKIRRTYHFGNPYLFLPYEISYRNLRRIKWNVSYLLKVRKGLMPNNYSISIPYLNQTSKLSYFIYKMIPSIKTTFWHQLGLDNLKKDIIERYIADNIPFVVGNAPNCFDIFRNEYSLPEKKLNLLPQNLTLKKVVKDKVELRKLLNIPNDAITIGMIAHFRDDKYFDFLFDAFIRLLNKTEVKIHLVILGNKENESTCLNIYKNLKKRVKENKLEDSISVLSNIEVVSILNILDIAVLVSQIEGMPNSVMEYMAYGIPCVVSNHPGCKQLLGDSEYLIENKLDILEEKLKKLIYNKKEREVEGNLNLERIKKFNLPSYVENLEKIISKYI